MRCNEGMKPRQQSENGALSDTQFLTNVIYFISAQILFQNMFFFNWLFSNKNVLFRSSLGI